jgi:hypothetical protein
LGFELSFMNTSTTNEMSDTPLTDAATELYGERPFMTPAVPVKFAQQLERELAVSLANQLKAMQEVEFWKAKAYEAEQFEGKHEAEAELRYQEVLRKANDDASEPIREMSDKLGLQLGECILQHGVPLLSESYEKAEAEVEELKLELSASKAEVEKLHEENKILNRQVAYLQSSYSEATCKWLKAQKIIDDSRLGAINLIKK